MERREDGSPWRRREVGEEEVRLGERDWDEERGSVRRRPLVRLRERVDKELETLHWYLYEPMRRSGYGLWLDLDHIKKGGPYKWPTSENEGIFRDGPLIRHVSVNRFEASINQFCKAVACSHLG